MIASKRDEHHTFLDPSVLKLLKSMSTVSSDDVNNKMLDMSVESTAIIAASIASNLPALPEDFEESIPKESCVWLNAFSGRSFITHETSVLQTFPLVLNLIIRVYRDAARSDYFNNWFCTKV